MCSHRCLKWLEKNTWSRLVLESLRIYIGRYLTFHLICATTVASYIVLAFLYMSIYFPTSTNFILIVTNVLYTCFTLLLFKVHFSEPGVVPKEFRLTEEDVRVLRQHYDKTTNKSAPKVKAPSASKEGNANDNNNTKKKKAKVSERHPDSDVDDDESIDATTSLPLSINQLVTLLPLKTRGKFGQVRHCIECRCLKPDRSYHCRAIGRCVLKLEHFCPFVGNAIGCFNAKFYIQFLVCSIALNAFGAAFLVPPIVTFDQRIADYILPVGIVTTVAIVFLILSGHLLRGHFMMTLRNQTEVEKAYGVTWANDWKGYTFDLGSWWRNWTQVFGYNVAMWVLPFESTPGNGCDFPVVKVTSTAVPPTSAQSSDVES